MKLVFQFITMMAVAMHSATTTSVNAETQNNDIIGSLRGTNQQKENLRRRLSDDRDVDARVVVLVEATLPSCKNLDLRCLSHNATELERLCETEEIYEQCSFSCNPDFCSRQNKEYLEVEDSNSDSRLDSPKEYLGAYLGPEDSDSDSRQGLEKLYLGPDDPGLNSDKNGVLYLIHPDSEQDNIYIVSQDPGSDSDPNDISLRFKPSCEVYDDDPDICSLYRETSTFELQKLCESEIKEVCSFTCCYVDSDSDQDITYFVSQLPGSNSDQNTIKIISLDPGSDSEQNNLFYNTVPQHMRCDQNGIFYNIVMDSENLEMRIPRGDPNSDRQIHLYQVP